MQGVCSVCKRVVRLSTLHEPADIVASCLTLWVHKVSRACAGAVMARGRQSSILPGACPSAHSLPIAMLYYGMELGA